MDAAGGRPEIYIVFGRDESAIGDYSVRVLTWTAGTETTWTVTARVNGEVAWVEDGIDTPPVDDSSFGFSISSSTPASLAFVGTVTVDFIAESEC